MWRKINILAVAGFVLTGCAEKEGDRITAGPENQEEPTYGSATDIVPATGGPTATNLANRADSGLGGPANRDFGNYQQQPLPGQQSDRELEKKIKVMLTTGSQGTTGVIASNQLTAIQVQVQDGVVTLTGPAAGEEEKRIIQEQVSGVKGVRSVVNKLQPGARSVEDQALEPLVPRDGQNR